MIFYPCGNFMHNLIQKWCRIQQLNNEEDDSPAKSLTCWIYENELTYKICAH